MKKQKIFIVKSESKITNAIKQGLEDNGYHADVAYNGSTGLKMFTDHQYDLAIIDINLADENAYELCKQFRLSNEHIPIIFLSSNTDITERLEGYLAGADDYIIKPFDFKEFLFKIRVFLKRSNINPKETTNILKAGDLELNPDTKMVKRNNKLINLTAKEFQLLEYMLRNKNRIISRSEIAFHVWGINFETNTNMIEVYINYVRNKIDKHFGHKLIQTHVGMGYILKDE